MPTLLARWMLPAAMLACMLSTLLPGTAFSERGPRLQLPAATGDDPLGAQVIVKYKALGSLMRASAAAGTAGHGPQHAVTMARRTGLALTDGRIIDSRSQVLRGGAGVNSAELARRLAADAEVEYAVPDRRRYAMALPNDPLLAGGSGVSPAAGQWYLRAPDSTFLSAIDAVGAWAVTAGSASVVVADLDTGVVFSHPDLANKLYAGYDFITNVTTAGDSNGRDADASDPGDWTTAGECGSGVAASTSSWHGTQTAGLIGAQTGNGIGMASVGHDVMIQPVRVLGKCGGMDSDIVAAMLWAGGLSSIPVANPHPARVINLSLGSSGSCNAAYTDAVARLNAAGVVVVAAAGNEEGLAVATPANCAGVIAVSGVRHAGTKVGFSSLGPEVAIAAPAGNCVNTSGECLYPILTTTNSGTQGPVSNTYSDGTDYSVGTSFSTPLVSGTVALMFSVNPALTATAVKSLLQSSARAFPTAAASVAQCHAPNGVVQDECQCTTSTCGAGLLDARAAVTAAAAGAVPTAHISASSSTVLAGASVSFDGSSSLAAGGRSIASYAWSITSGTGIASISGASSGSGVQVATRGTGSFTVQLTVTDSAGLKASTTSSVYVNAPAAPAVQLLSSTQVVAAGGSVSFDGSGSTAASGLGVTGWQWTITSLSSTGLAWFSSSTTGSTATVATLGNGSGSFTVRLTVTDSLGQSASTSTTITVNAVHPTASIVASATSVQTGASVSFDGGSSTATEGRSIAGYQWAITSGGTIASIGGLANGSSASVVTSAAGSFTVQLTVTDSQGSQDARTATVTVTAPTTPTGTDSGSSGGGGGGGAFSWAWVAGVGIAALALRASGGARRRRR